MNLLLDTHVVLWAASASPRLPADARALLEDPDNELVFSAASLWEVAIKRGIRREEFNA
ncbi:MAG: PIN domain nuclease, partial [Acidobacteriota bacterium]|nr:PIN domain nuclease [Acidobacteriota bacterium]